ncbi:MAG: hypothetical protein V4736_08665, partial [Bdellovibrionota bacterium]
MFFLKMVALLTFSAFAQDSTFTIVDKDLSTANYEFKVQYPELLEGSVPAYLEINKKVSGNILAGCEDTPTDVGFYYVARVDVVSLNPKYVSLESFTETYCGGAHPFNSSTNSLFNSITGQEIDFDNEIPGQSVDTNYDVAALHRKKLASIILSYPEASIELKNCLGDFNLEMTFE